ncbi:MAG: DegV family protein [Anaerolineaceae bacterium]
MSVRIVTDSTCDLPSKIIEEYGIRVIPLHIHVGLDDYLDGIDMSREVFYKNLPSFREQPTTAVPSTHKFRAIYSSLADEGADEVLSIHISQSLSAIVNVAQTAANEMTNIPVTVFDSQQLSLGTGFAVLKAAELAHAGYSVNEILPVLEDQIKRTHVWAALDTLEFLKRSGRMNRVISSIGEFLQLKPILKMYAGTSGVERVRTQKKAIERIREMLIKFSPFERIAFLHSGAVEQAKYLKAEISHLLPNSETWLEVINPVLGAHIGPGVVGFACITKE